jgi:hypothetical protein
MQPDEPKEQWQQPAQQPPSDVPIVEQPPVQAVEQPLSPEQPAPVETVPASETEVAETAPMADGEDELVRWDAKEHIHREKNPAWYAIFAVVVVALMAMAFFLMKSLSFAILVPVMAAALLLYVQRPPVVNTYTLSRKGLHINDKLYTFDTFKEFGLIADDDEHSVMLVPRKRFHLGVTLYFPEEAGEAIVDMLAARLPMREIRLDPIERLIRALHI